MTAWPGTLPQTPQILGCSQTNVDQVLRSPMGYGPAKLRRRVSAEQKNLSLQLTLTTTQVDTLQTFYWTTLECVGVIDWVDHLSTSSPQASAQYRFLEPPGYTSLGGELWPVSVNLEMLP